MFRTFSYLFIQFPNFPQPCPTLCLPYPHIFLHLCIHVSDVFLLFPKRAILFRSIFTNANDCPYMLLCYNVVIPFPSCPLCCFFSIFTTLRIFSRPFHTFAYFVSNMFLNVSYMFQYFPTCSYLFHTFS